MSDVDLRALERDVAAGGDAATRLRLARALERAGRRDEVPELLSAERYDADVRRELATWPAWIEEDATGGRARAIDVAPVRTPRERWSAALPGTQPRTWLTGASLLASAFGVVVVGETSQLYNLGSGHEVARLDPTPSAAAFQSATLRSLLPRRTLEWRHPETGREVARHDLPGEGGFVTVVGETLVAHGDETRVFSVETPGVPPVHLFSASVLGAHEVPELLVVGELIYLTRQFDHVVLDRRSGRIERWSRGRVRMADERAALATLEDGALVAYDPAGKTLFESREDLQPLALAHDFVVARAFLGGGRRAAVLLDRTGARRAELAPATLAAVARDVVYLASESQVLAFSSSGERLFELDAGDEVRALALVSKRLLVATDATLRCYEDVP